MLSYYATFSHPILNPKNFFLLLIVTAAFFVFQTRKTGFLAMPLMKWILVYCVLFLFWYLLPDNYLTVDELRKKIFALFFFMAMIVLMHNDTNLNYSHKAILLVTLLAIGNNIYEFFNPYAFYSQFSALKIIGRSAGFYINANIAGEAIVLGMLFSLPILPRKYRYPFALLALAGIMVTFSRAGMTGWLIVTLLYVKSDILDRKMSVLFFSAGLILLVMFGPFLLEYLTQEFGRGAHNLINRLDFFTGQEHGLDHSQSERSMVAAAAFNLFADHPFFGAGLGVTNHWQFRVGAHNMYLTFAAQFGIIGMLLYPMLIYSIVYRAKNSARHMSLPFAIYMLLIGMTTHNIMDAYHLLIAMALMANIVYQSRKGVIDYGFVYYLCCLLCAAAVLNGLLQHC